MSIKMQKLVFNPFSSANILACFAFEEMLIASCDLFFGVHSNNVIFGAVSSSNQFKCNDTKSMD